MWERKTQVIQALLAMTPRRTRSHWTERFWAEKQQDPRILPLSLGDTAVLLVQRRGLKLVGTSLVDDTARTREGHLSTPPLRELANSPWLHTAGANCTRNTLLPPKALRLLLGWWCLS